MFGLRNSILIIVGLSYLISTTSTQQQYCTTNFDCGSINFRCPFWRLNNNNATTPSNGYCRYPGLGINCTNGVAVLTISNHPYQVENIDYLQRILTVVDVQFIGQTCPITAHNYTFDNTIFHLSPSTTRLAYFRGCDKIPMYLSHRRSYFSCFGSDNMTHSYFFQFHIDDFTWSGNCTSFYVIPIPWDTTSFTFRNPDLMLQKGFELIWSPTPGEGRYQIPIAAIVAGTLITAVGVLITVATIIICCLRQKFKAPMFPWKKKTKNAKNVDLFIKYWGSSAAKQFKYSEIKKMTNSFKSKIGQGGFGSVFEGKLLDGKMVAVKVLSETKGDGSEFINEVASISRTSHVNIVTLLGFCVKGPKRALVYELMRNGSLEKFIYDEAPLKTQPHLGWETLYKIAVGIARGLEYLHRGCNVRIMHFDIKPHNILLDDDFTPKIADFGLSKLCRVDANVVQMRRGRGTTGYIAPEMVTKKLEGISDKSDVYSYGMMVLEMVGGRKNLDVKVTNLSQIYFPHWISKRVDLNEGLGFHGITSLEDQNIARKMILVSLWCIQTDPINRPPMSRVLYMLEGSLEALEIPPNSFMSTTSPREELGS